VTVNSVDVRRAADHRLLRSAVVRPDGVVPVGTAAPLSTALSTLAGRAGPYYVVRVSVPVNGRAGAAATGDALLAAVLPTLIANARAA
jgi:hypothetical protein